MARNRKHTETLVDCWVPNDVADAALRAANDHGISRAELLRQLLGNYLIIADYTE